MRSQLVDHLALNQVIASGSRSRAWTWCLELLEQAIACRLADVASFGACLSWRPELLKRMRQERSAGVVF